MGCVILPSEIARLVYGYLVKENLNEIALQFLEKSPYLTDCCQIVKSGYQFNTKLMGKELQDLLQEYSVIHNIVNNKVSLLSKTSLLYKRIKLKCESLSEIVDLILFWKFKSLKNDENSINSEKSTKVNTSDIRNNSEIVSNKSSSVNINSSTSNNNTTTTTNNNNNNNSCFNNSNNNSSLLGNISISDSFEKQLGKESSYSKSKSLAEQELCAAVESKLKEIDNSEKEQTSQYMQVDISQDFQGNSTGPNAARNQDAVGRGGDDCPRTSVPGASETQMPDLCLSSSVLTIDMNSESKDLPSNDSSDDHLESNDGDVEYESQIKIVRIEKENETDAPVTNSYCASVPPESQNQGNLGLENGSVVFVGSDVGNVALDQDRSQIIVIPIDYYKSQNEIPSQMEINETQKENYYQNAKDVIHQEKNEMIYGAVAATQNDSTSTVDQMFSERMNNKVAAVDENIVTESDFLKNRDIIFNIEKELNRPRAQTQSQPLQTTSQRETGPNPGPPPSTAPPVIVLQQTLVPAKSRFRSILPKDNTVPSVVIVQPLMESNQCLTDKSNPTPCDRAEKPKADGKKVKKKVPLVQKCKNVVDNSEEGLSMPSIKTPVPPVSYGDVNLDPDPEKAPGAAEKPGEGQKEAKTATDEKENLEKGGGETKKTETPLLVTRRNSKRLSLSTPRRRSHVRALEFETPPKTKEEKKSRTSPKAKVATQKTTERKSVRNTLFKSPIPENSAKSPRSSLTGTESGKNVGQEVTEVRAETGIGTGSEALNELSIPIATRSPNAKLSDAWENLTGVGCVIGQIECSNSVGTVKKMWDADLRCFISENCVGGGGGGGSGGGESSEKKRIRKPDKVQKDYRKNLRKKTTGGSSGKKAKAPTTVSPSKMSLTAKRNTYSINGNEEGSPIRSLLDDLKIVTPFKDIDTIRPAEETPLTKLLRENINTIDIDLSMINTPSFPPTPSIVITPDLDDLSAISGTNYYSPSKDFTKEKVVKITDYFRVDAEKTSKKDTKEMHEKVIDDLVTKAKEIIGIGKEGQDENSLKRRPSGKILSMVKIQMLTQCDKKLCENIPINEEANFGNSFVNPAASTANTTVEESTIVSNVSDIKGELEAKRQRALRKIKVVKENLSQARNNRVTKRSRKRKRSLPGNGSGKRVSRAKVNSSNETVSDRQSLSWSEDRKAEVKVFHSTPYDKRKCGSKFETSDLTERKVDDTTLNDIRQEFPSFQDTKDRFPELTEKSRKKIHYVEHFLKLDEIAKFLRGGDGTGTGAGNGNADNPPVKLFLKPSLRRFFQVFYKWLRHPHKHEMNASPETAALLQSFLSDFDRINAGLSRANKRPKRNSTGHDTGSLKRSSKTDDSIGPDKTSVEDGVGAEEKTRKTRTAAGERNKVEDAEDGFVSILPLKKRKSTVQPVEERPVPPTKKSGDSSKACSTETVSQAQNFLQDIDVDRFLSQIHGQANR